jgi:sterol desaturase/sphingolipid hydroxylase (fatty acid hydroxylase superfamily)
VVALPLVGSQVYDTVDHDAHHSRFECNYAFPFPYLDILHGTYTGTFAGRRYLARKPRGFESDAEVVARRQADVDVPSKMQ